MGGSLSNQRFVAHFQTSDWLTFGLTKTGKLHGEYSLPAPKLIAWLQIDVQATLAATVEKIDIAKTESDVVRMAISYVFDFHLAEFLQHLEEAYTFRHIREPLEK